MEFSIYIKRDKEVSRKVIIAQKDNNDGYALILYQSNLEKSNNKFVAKYLPFSTINLENCKCYCNDIYGCLGLIYFRNEAFLILATQIENIGIVNCNCVYQIKKVTFISLNNDLYDYSLNKDNLNNKEVNHPCIELIQYLQRGSFYFSNNFDLTHSIQSKFNETENSLSYLETASNNFFWNKYILKEFLNFRKNLLDIEKEKLDKSGILLIAIQGFISINNVKTINDNYQICIISRLSCKNYNIRGIDNDGNTSDYIESEIIFSNDDCIFSFLQVRGSIPVFLKLSHEEQSQFKIELAQDIKSASTAFNRHFEKMIKKYKHINIINFFNENGENILEKVLDNYIQNSSDFIKHHIKKVDIQFNNNDNWKCKEIISNISKYLDNDFYFLKKNNKTIKKQSGVVSINYLNYYNNINLVQTSIAWYILKNFISDKNIDNNNILINDKNNFKTIFEDLWLNNGKCLNKINICVDDDNYTLDKSKEDVINFLLGRYEEETGIILYDPLLYSIQTNIKNEIKKFSIQDKINILIGTWNVGGHPPAKDIFQWLYPEDEKLPDIYVIGIEEVVELIAKQVISTDTEKAKAWENEILKNLKKIDSSYVHLKSKQIIGTYITIFVRDINVEKINNVESALIKTGFKGSPANKGGVAISMNYYDSSLCFVTAHLAAGQLNIKDRNRDYHTISENIVFKGGKKIRDHDIIVWLGDFNYRINNLSNDVVRKMIEDDHLEELLKNDQLKTQITTGKIFNDYKEGQITFKPTYKFDIGTENYDTSPKLRIPAWCDRILFKAKNIKQKYYKSVDVCSCDHRPIKSLFEVIVTKIDKETKKKIEIELYNEQLNILKKEFI